MCFFIFRGAETTACLHIIWTYWKIRCAIRPLRVPEFFPQAFQLCFIHGWKLRIRVGGMCSEGEYLFVSKLFFWDFFEYICESRAETHERFYIIEVHRHRFEMSARKVPFEKCTRWRKVCGRSAKDQIGDSIYSFFFTISSERFAKGARKMRERRIHSSHVLPKMGCI